MKIFLATIGDGLPTQAFTVLKRLASCQSTFYCGTNVPGDQCRSVTHRSTRSDVAVGPDGHSPIAIDRGWWEPGPWLCCTFRSVLGTLAPTGKRNDLRFARPVRPVRQNPVLEVLGKPSQVDNTVADLLTE